MNNLYGIGLNGNYYVFPLTTSFQVSEQSSVSEFTLITREKVVDHKINEPRRISVSGVISKLGKNINSGFKFIDKLRGGIEVRLGEQSNDIITDTYNLFRNIKEANEFVVIHGPNLMIPNCVLVDISWTHNADWVEFSLSFNEIRTFVFRDTREKIRERDPSLPSLNDLVPQSFVQSALLKDQRELLAIISRKLYDEGIIQGSYVTHWTNDRHAEKAAVVYLGIIGSLAIVAAGIGLAVGAIVAFIAIAGAVAASTNAVPGIGSLVGAVLFIAALTAAALWALFKWISDLFKKWAREKEFGKDFIAWKTDVENNKEITRHNKSMKVVFKLLGEFDKHIDTYTVSSNINQQLVLNMNGVNYVLRFYRQNDLVTTPWKYTFTQIEDARSDKEIGKEEWRTLSPELSVFKLNDSKAVLRDGEWGVYFVWKFGVFSKEEMDYMQKTKKSIMKTDIRQLQIIVSAYDMEELSKDIGSITLQALRVKHKRDS